MKKSKPLSPPSTICGFNVRALECSQKKQHIKRCVCYFSIESDALMKWNDKKRQQEAETELRHLTRFDSEQLLCNRGQLKEKVAQVLSAS